MKSVADIWREAEEVKSILPQVLDLNNEAHANGVHTLRNFYKKIILSDIDFALDKKIEQELWNSCFKIPISKLQPNPRDPKLKKSAENSPLLSWFLESAAGFYLVLLQEICAQFDLDVPFCKRNVCLGILANKSVSQKPKNESCLYICQYCLIHLGDLARYRNQLDEAVGYYKEAVHVDPSSGHPYNQLALLEAAGGDRLSTMYYYCRSLTLKHPFPPAKKNLEKLHKKNTSVNITYKLRNRLSAEEFLSSFLKFQGQIGLGCDLDQAEQMGRLMGFTLAPLIATESLTAHQVTQMLQINMYAIDRLKTNGGPNSCNNEDQRCLRLAIELAASILNACLVSTYSLSGNQLITYGFLPVVKLVLDWFFVNPDLLLHPLVFKRHPLWSAAAKLFNELHMVIGHSDEDQDVSPLPEDANLVNFSPLRQLASKKCSSCSSNEEKSNLLRGRRILERGKWLAQQEQDSVRCLITILKSDSPSSLIFECPKVDESDVADLDDQMKALSTDPLAGVQKKGILKEVKILTRKPRNVALAAILKQNTEESDVVLPPVNEEGNVDKNVSDGNKQVKFQMPQKSSTPPPPFQMPVQPPLLPLPNPPLLPTPPTIAAKISHNSYHYGPSLPPPLERLRTEQKDRDILNDLGLFSGFGTSLTSNGPTQQSSWPNISIPPPSPSVPPPGMGFRPPVPPPWQNFNSLPPLPTAVGTGPGPGNSAYSLFNSQTWHPGQIPTGFNNLPAENRNSFERLPYDGRNYFSLPAPAAPSLWSGPGPSPLERLLEQQKAMRGTSPSKNVNNLHKMNNGL